MFMWLFQSIISNIPSWIWPALAGLGLVSNVIVELLVHLPPFRPWKLPLELLTFLMFTAGVFMWGGSGVMDMMKAEVAAMEAKIAVSEQKSQDTNVEIQTKVVTKIKTVHDTQIVVQERIKEVTKQIDAECKLDPAVVKILNDAARNQGVPAK